MCIKHLVRKAKLPLLPHPYSQEVDAKLELVKTVLFLVL